MSSNIIYKDKNLLLTTTHLYIYYYWFPFGFTKTINLQNIQSIQVFKPRHWLQCKTWGMGIDLQVWWPLDWYRQLGSLNAIVITLNNCNKWPKIGITPGHGELVSVELVANKLYELCPNMQIHH